MSHDQAAPSELPGAPVRYTIRLHDFDGFYESIHDHEINEALSQMFQDDEGESHMPDDLWREISIDKEGYCRLYIEWLKEYLLKEHALDLPSMAFDSVRSPREYNFETDSLNVTIDEADFVKIKERAHRKETALRASIVETFTARDGFIPFYSNDPQSWLEAPMNEWDEIELGVALRAITGRWNDSDVIQAADYQVQEALHGEVERWLTEKGKRMLAAWDAIQSRANDDSSPALD